VSADQTSLPIICGYRGRPRRFGCRAISSSSALSRVWPAGVWTGLADGTFVPSARARKISLGTCENSVVRCPVVVGRDEELAALAEVFGRMAGGCGACVVVTGGAGCWKDRVGQRGGRWGAGGGRSSWPVVRRRPIRSRRCGRLVGRCWTGCATAVGRTPYLPALGILVPHWAADPAFPRCRPAGRARRSDVAGSALAVARTLGGHFRHLPGGATQATSRTRRTGPW
jgi:hypothetical protein